MKEITFPNLNLKFTLNSIAISLGNIQIYWYAIFIVSAFAIAILFCKRDDGKYNIKYENILEVFLLIIPVSIIFARLYYVIFRLDYYIQNPIEIFNIQNGGLAIYGGIIGAIITIAIYCRIKKINMLDILDYIAPFLALGQAIRKMGKFL